MLVINNLMKFNLPISFLCHDNITLFGFATAADNDHNTGSKMQYNIRRKNSHKMQNLKNEYQTLMPMHDIRSLLISEDLCIIGKEEEEEEVPVHLPVSACLPEYLSVCSIVFTLREW